MNNKCKKQTSVFRFNSIVVNLVYNYAWLCITQVQYRKLMITTKFTFMGKSLCVVAALVALQSCVIVDVNTDDADVVKSQNIAETKQVPNNIIMVVADGTGPAYTSAYRYFIDDPSTAYIETTIFDDILVGSARTYPHPDSGLVTDSAASATALSAGIKTYNGAIGMDIDKQALETVLHRARKLGLKTGLAVTSHIVHATPAAYMVANESRRNYAQLADLFYDQRINGEHLADIMLGAGWEHFIREDRNLVEEFKADGYQYIDKYEQLSSISANTPVLGLFGNDSLPSALDDSEPLRLTKLTEAIVPYLENDKGYFLLLEASQVDWAGHSNDITSAMAEMHDLAKTMEYLYEYSRKHPNTLVILTADHNTGGLSIGANGDYKWEPQWLKGLKASIPTIASNIVEQTDKAAYASHMLGFILNDDEAKNINAITRDMKPRDVQLVIKKLIDARSHTGWTTSGHTAIDVQVFAFGPGAKRFAGNQNNTEIAHKIFDLLDQAHKQP